jgi:hypothetical protein
LAIPKALTHAGVTPAEVSYYEINEAFAAVALANKNARVVWALLAKDRTYRIEPATMAAGA